MSIVSSVNLSLLAPPSVPPELRSTSIPPNSGQQILSPASNDLLHEKFTQFVGETFFGQMIKAMRSTVGKPAYFHGGRAEEVFQGQLDQTLAQHLTEVSSDRFVEVMFHRQFPRLDQAAATGDPSAPGSNLSHLNQLTRR